MADKKLNAVSTANDGAYIYAEDASGNQIKISKADLATVVAALINPMLCGLTYNADFNSAVDGGVYSIADPNKTLGNNPGVRYGVLVTFEAGSNYRMQLALDSDGGIWMRFFNTSPVAYKNWKVISYS